MKAPRPSTRTSPRSRAPAAEKGSSVLGICGIIIALGGMYFLFVDPAADSVSGVMSLHKAIIGQTLTIVGTILIAVQWRPR